MLQHVLLNGGWKGLDVGEPLAEQDDPTTLARPALHRTPRIDQLALAKAGVTNERWIIFLVKNAIQTERIVVHANLLESESSLFKRDKTLTGDDDVIQDLARK